MPVSAARVLRAIAGEEQTDAELLGRFIDCRDQAAFATLVRRHGAMVYGVCRRMLPTDQDAEDAFQATFLVLAEKARAAAPREVANWLYGVARRAALMSRRSIARRRERTGEMPDRPAPDPTPLDDLRAALDGELGRLPDAYRAVIVLCDLEGRTRREAAAVLGWPEGTVVGRLVRVRELLARRMARHAPRRVGGGRPVGHGRGAGAGTAPADRGGDRTGGRSTWCHGEGKADEGRRCPAPVGVRRVRGGPAGRADARRSRGHARASCDGRGPAESPKAGDVAWGKKSTGCRSRSPGSRGRTATARRPRWR